MAINYAALSATLNRAFADPLADLIARSNPVLRAMSKRALSSRDISWRLRTASVHSPQGVADGSAVATPSGTGSSYAPAILDWTTQISHFELPTRLLAQVEGQGDQLGALLRTELQQAALDHADRLASLLFQPNASGLDPVGIPDIINTGNTYAGVNRATTPVFNSVVYDAQVSTAPAPVSTELFNEADRLFFNRNKIGLFDIGSNYSIVTSNSILSRYRSLFTSIDVSSLSAAHFVNQMNASGSLGQASAAYAGVPILRTAEIAPVAGDLADSSRIYFLDMNQMGYAFLSNNAASRANVSDIESAPVIDGVPVEIVLKGIDGERLTGYLRSYCQVWCKDPVKAGMVIKNVRNT